MSNWMLRGLVFGGGMIVVRLFQGTLISVWQTQAALISIVLLVLFIAGVLTWGVLDGREDAASNPDPDRRGDLAMTWLLAGLVAGLLSGAVVWLIAMFYESLYAGGLINELTTFAAFTALVVFVFAIIGVSIGRWRIDRTGAYKSQDGEAGSDEDRADTDVFAAVRSDHAGHEGAEWPQQQSGGVATAERDEHQTAPAYSDERAETSRAHGAAHTEDTEKLPSHDAATDHIDRPTRSND